MTRTKAIRRAMWSVASRYTPFESKPGTNRWWDDWTDVRMLNANRRYANFNAIGLIEGSSVPAVNQILPSNFHPRSIQLLNDLKHRQCPSTLPLKYSNLPFTLGPQPLFCLLRIPINPFLH